MYNCSRSTHPFLFLLTLGIQAAYKAKNIISCYCKIKFHICPQKEAKAKRRDEEGNTSKPCIVKDLISDQC